MAYLLIKFPFLLLVHVASPNGYVYYICDYLLKYIEARSIPKPRAGCITA